MEPITLTAGDPCPNCGGELAAARVGTDEQYRKAFDRENPVPLPANTDTASATVRAELGALQRCTDCGYQARFKDEGKGKGKGKDKA